MCNWRYAFNHIQLLRAKSKTLKCTRQSQKIIWGTIINRDMKIKDKLIRVRAVKNLKSLLQLKEVVQTRDASSLK